MSAGMTTYSYKKSRPEVQSLGWLFRGGEVVLPDGVRRQDIRVRDERIVEVGGKLEIGTDHVVEVGGSHLLPGAIDPHGHQWEPGFTSRPDFTDTTASAAVGGVTTLLDHPLTPPVVLDRSTFAAKAALGERTALVDFGLHGGAAPDRLDEIAGLWQAGATGIKLFTCPTGTPLDGFDDPTALEAAMGRIARIGALALVHAEDVGELDRAATTIRARSGGGVADFPAWHSIEAELRAVERLLTLTERTGASTYIVHASHPAIVDAARSAAGRGAEVMVETCPHYLHLTDADLRGQGAWAMTAPPVRDAGARDGLRVRASDGRIDAIGSDHCAIRASREDRRADGLRRSRACPGWTSSCRSSSTSSPRTSWTCHAWRG